MRYVVKVLLITFFVLCSFGHADIIAYWNFDEGSGTIAEDSSGNANTATLVNGPIWTQGILNYALAFDGIDDYVTVPHSASLSTTSAITISACAYFDTTTGRKAVVTKDSPEISYWLGQDSGQPCLILSSDGSSYTTDWGTSGTITTGSWYHIVGVYDGSQIKIYVNAVLNGTTDYSGGIYSSTSDVAIGDSIRWSNLFNGVIDEVRIYNAALSQEEVQSLYNSYPAPPTPTPTPSPTALPTPTWSNASLENTIAKRMSTTNYGGSEVTDQLLSNVLWAAYGHTPNGRTIQPVNDSTIIYVCRQDAAYKYIPESHSLQLWKDGDYTYVGQYDSAPVKICLIHDTNKADEASGMMEIGKIGQNIYLEAIALGLATRTTAGDADEAETALGLPANERSKIIMPLGYPSSAYDFSSSPHSGNLPEVQDTGVSLELVLSDLDVATQWSDVPITSQELSNIVWAAYGTSYLYDNVNNVLHRTVPSAYSYYPFIIYVVNETAAYEYDPSTHSIDMQVGGDKRQSIADASEQFVADAPLILIAGSTRYNGAYISYWDYEVGSIGQNVLLESTGLGLGANMVEVSDPAAIRSALNLGFNLYHMFVIPVGHTEGPTPTLPTVQFSSSSSNADESLGAVNIHVTLSTGWYQTVAVPYSISGTAAGSGIDYSDPTPSSPLTFNPGENSKDLAVAIVDDDELEDDETVVVTLGIPTSATLGSPSEHTLTIIDNDEYTGSWWNSTWLYRRNLEFDNSGQTEDLMDFPVLVKLSASNFDYDKATTDGIDLRFLDSDDMSKLNYHIEKWNRFGDSFIWVRVLQIDGSSSTDFILMYYGNSEASDAQDEAGTYNDDYKGVWHLSEDPSGTPPQMEDSTSHNNDGTAYGLADGSVPARISNGIDFPATGPEDDYIEIPDSDSLDMTIAMTISAWVNIDQSNKRYDAVLTKDEPSLSWWFGLNYDEPVIYVSANGSSFATCLAGSAIPVGNWNHIAVAYDDSNMQWYINGTAADAPSFSGPIYVSISDVWIGESDRWSSYDNAFDGTIDEIKISNITRSADWIKAEYLSETDSFITYGPEEERPPLACIIYVPQDYPTIQDAIDAAFDGCEIIVSPDTYYENINFGGKDIILRSTDPTSATVVESTVINGRSTDTVVTFSGTELTTCVLSGFTIANGYAQFGGGINGNGTLATIQYNNITSNTAHGELLAIGGGLAYCGGIIQYNSISDNQAWADVGNSYGGGLAYCGGSIQYNTISSNWAGSDLIANCFGGGLYGCDATIQSNTISDNWAWSNNGDCSGGGLSDCDGTIKNNTVSNNTAQGGYGKGGGLHGCDGTIENNIITTNSAASNNSLSNGGGLDSCTAIVQNNIIYGNEADQGGGLANCNGTVQNNTITTNTAQIRGGGLYNCSGTIQNCIIWYNIGEQLDYCSTPTCCCIQDWTGGGTWNISDNPKLADYVHLQVDSPCIDAGCTVTLTQDFEGDPRPYHAVKSESRGNTSYFDIGADEIIDTIHPLAVFSAYDSPVPSVGKNYFSSDTPITAYVREPMVNDSDARYLCIGWLGEGSVPDFGTSTAVTFVLDQPSTITWLWKTQVRLSVISEHDTPVPSDITYWDVGSTVTAYMQDPIVSDGEGTRYVCTGWTGEGSVPESGTDASVKFVIDKPSTITWLWKTQVRLSVISEHDTPVPSGITYWDVGSTVTAYMQDPIVSGDCGIRYVCTGWLGEGSVPETATDSSVTFVIDQPSAISWLWQAEPCIIYVPQDYPTIQEAIDAAFDCCEIIVSPDTYYENINFGGKNITLRSTDPNNSTVVESTIIDGDAAGSVVTFSGTELTSCVLSGLTITNGYAVNGGGISGNGTLATIHNNNISTNTTYLPYPNGRGGGIYECHGTIYNNNITTNTAQDRGGGLAQCSGTIQHNIISGNLATNYGGGLYGCNGTVQKNIISYNWAITGGGLDSCNGIGQQNSIFRNTAQYGGGLAHGDFGIIQNNIITTNTASIAGGGLWDCEGTIQNNTICGNSSNNHGGGLDWCPGPIRNCIIWKNSAPLGAQLYDCSEPTYCCIQDWPGGGTCNISDNPKLEPDGVHLKSESPCIDAGCTVPLAQDFEGDPRGYDGRRDGPTGPPCPGDGSDFDIGADEYSEAVTLIVEESSGSPSATNVPVRISLDNTMNIAGIQLTLCDVVDLLTLGSKPLEPDPTRAAGFTVAANEVSGGCVTVLMVSLTGNLVASGNGPVFTLYYDVDDGVTSGTVIDMQLIDYIVADENNKELPVIPIDGIFTVTMDLKVKGDLDGNGYCDLFDLLRQIDIIIQSGDPPTPYELWVGDMDDDGDINVIDVLMLNDCVLCRTLCDCALHCGWVLAAKEESLAEAIAETEELAMILGTDTLAVSVYLGNDEPVKGLSFLLSRIPDGLTLRATRLADDLKDFHVDFNQVGQKAKVILISLGGELIPAGDGPIMDLVFEASKKKIRSRRRFAVLKNIKAAGEQNKPVKVKLKIQNKR